MPAALVTGVSRTRGIGAAVAARLRDDGFTVITAGWTPYDAEYSPDSAEQVQTDLQADLAEPDAPQRLFEAAEARAGVITALVLVHAFDGMHGLFEVTAESIDQHMAVNVRSFLLLMRAFAERIRDTERTGRIVLFGSGPPQKGSIAYGASKGAIEWMTYSAAAELGPLGITVNAINPGPNQTGWMSSEIERELAARTPLGRTGRPEDAAALVSFLLSDGGAFINGQLITSDGGSSTAG